MNNVNKIFANIERKVKGLVKKVRLSDYGEMAIKRIQLRTRLGYGVLGGERGAPKYKLPKLSQSYKDFRSGKVIFWTDKGGRVRSTTNVPDSMKPKLPSTTKPSKSNLTLTGQLLESIKSRVSGNKIILYLKENRNDGKSNKDIVGWQSEQGRDFFELTDKEVKGLRNQLKKDLIKILKKK